MDDALEWRSAPEIRAFVDAGQAFHQHVLSLESSGAWLSALLSRLVALYAAGLALPAGAVEEGEEVVVVAAFAVSEQEWHTLWQRLGEVLGPRRWYVAADPQINPPGSSTAVAIGDLADDLADIYRDITPGLRYWESATTTGFADTVWEWTFGFTMQWGRHAVAALGFLHHLVVDKHLDANDDSRTIE